MSTENDKLKENHDLLKSIVTKYEDYPYDVSFQLDTNTSIQFQGALDLTYDDDIQYILDESAYDTKVINIEAPSAIKHSLEYNDLQLHEISKLFDDHAMMNELFQKHCDEFNSLVAPLLSYFKELYNAAKVRFDKQDLYATLCDHEDSLSFIHSDLQFVTLHTLRVKSA